VRFELARLLAGSKIPALVPLLQRAGDAELSGRRRAVYTWVREELEAGSRAGSRRNRRRIVVTMAPR
jgi:hypothetical protein